MCNKDDQRPKDGLDDPDSWGPGAFGRTGKGNPKDQHRGLFFALLGLPLLLVACQSKPGGREEDDPMHWRLKGTGRAVRDQLDKGGNGHRDDKKR